MNQVNTDFNRTYRSFKSERSYYRRDFIYNKIVSIYYILFIQLQSQSINSHSLNYVHSLNCLIISFPRHCVFVIIENPKLLPCMIPLYIPLGHDSYCSYLLITVKLQKLCIDKIILNSNDQADEIYYLYHYLYFNYILYLVSLSFIIFVM